MFDTRDVRLLFVTRSVRMFAYGALSVVLFLYLQDEGWDQVRIGLLLTLVMIGDILLSFFLTTTADTFGRRRALVIGALLKLAAGLTFAFLRGFWPLALAGTIGVITATGGEVGPFLAVEQAGLTEVLTDRSQVPFLFGRFNLVAYFAQALGALFAGGLVTYLQEPPMGWEQEEAFRVVVCIYAACGGTNALLYSCLSTSVEPVEKKTVKWFGKFGLASDESRRTVGKLSVLFTIDAFAGGFAMQTMLVDWFHEYFGTSSRALGLMLMGANILAGFSALLAARLVGKIGAIKTMVYTHLPSNALLICVPYMPREYLAICVLLARFCISQMDVPARQAYVVAVVESNERSAAGGITNLGSQPCSETALPLLYSSCRMSSLED
eukprot:TRINITY_DN11953_c0_g1_i4.p1 TRINITY_DN11953_c0_g1~~TRINITY_DN11953_c0_g1_i4.p1  ORF type:complete len:381 (+),score=38.53 TRINITY_DN11953_c0_g1_i4:659-1801(+)